MLRLEIVTPEGIVFTEEVESVILPTEMGEVNILPGHRPLMTKVIPGQLQIFQHGQKTSLAVDRGFGQIVGDRVAVAVEAAIDVKRIDDQVIKEAKARAEAALEEAKKNPDSSQEELDELEAKLKFSLFEEMIKKNRR